MADEKQSNLQTPSERLLLIYRYVLTHHSFRIAELQDNLEKVGSFVSVKTLYNDLAKVNSATGLEIEYHVPTHTYRVKKPPFEPYELRLMVDGIQSSKFITQTEAQKLTQKIKGLTDAPTAATLNRQAYVANRVRSMNDSVVKDADRLHDCIASDSKACFKYFHYGADKKKQYSKKGGLYIVSPYALLWNDGNYYLYAYEGGKFKHFRVDRMENIRRYPEKREGKDEFRKKDLTARQSKVFNMYGGEKYTVKLRCQNRTADAILERFGKETMLIPDGAEHFIASVPVEISDQFFAWIAYFGRSMKSVHPAEVVQKMKDFIQKLPEMYKDEG